MSSHDEICSQLLFRQQDCVQPTVSASCSLSMPLSTAAGIVRLQLIRVLFSRVLLLKVLLF
jgi:hypothetical protein